MDFQVLKGKLCHLLDIAELNYEVDNRDYQQADSFREHLKCFIRVKPRPLDITRHPLLDANMHTMTISFLQPYVSWISSGPRDQDGILSTPSKKYRYNFHNVDAVFEQAVYELAYPQSDQGRDRELKKILLFQKLRGMITEMNEGISRLRRSLLAEIKAEVAAESPGVVATDEIDCYVSRYLMIKDKAPQF